LVVEKEEGNNRNRIVLEAVRFLPLCLSSAAQSRGKRKVMVYGEQTLSILGLGKTLKKQDMIKSTGSVAFLMTKMDNFPGGCKALVDFCIDAQLCPGSSVRTSTRSQHHSA
jgi:hypothetical protein